MFWPSCEEADPFLCCTIVWILIHGRGQKWWLQKLMYGYNQSQARTFGKLIYPRQMKIFWKKIFLHFFLKNVPLHSMFSWLSMTNSSVFTNPKLKQAVAYTNTYIHIELYTNITRAAVVAIAITSQPTSMPSSYIQFSVSRHNRESDEKRI